MSLVAYGGRLLPPRLILGLPLALVPLSQTENFLNNVSTASGCFLSQVAEQDQAQEAERVKTIEVLYERARLGRFESTRC